MRLSYSFLKDTSVSSHCSLLEILLNAHLNNILLVDFEIKIQSACLGKPLSIRSYTKKCLHLLSNAHNNVWGAWGIKTGWVIDSNYPCSQRRKLSESGERALC